MKSNSSIVQKNLISNKPPSYRGQLKEDTNKPKLKKTNSIICRRQTRPWNQYKVKDSNCETKYFEGERVYQVRNDEGSDEKCKMDNCFTLKFSSIGDVVHTWACEKPHENYGSERREYILSGTYDLEKGDGFSIAHCKFNNAQYGATQYSKKGNKKIEGIAAWKIETNKATRIKDLCNKEM